jgi:quercetin dioxygenase-like cupin family protein
MKTKHALIASLVISGGGLAADAPGFIRVTPSQVNWQAMPSGHGVQQAVLVGDPSKPGMYVIRVKFPPYTVDSPHWHPNARYVTVLEGTWYTGTGDKFDLSKAVALKPGSFMLHPAKAAHWDGAGGPETVVVQIIGEGPAETTRVDPSQPFWIEAPH